MGDEVTQQWQAGLAALMADRPALSARRAAVAEFAARHWSWDHAVDHYERYYAARRLD